MKSTSGRRIAVACDHAAVTLKKHVLALLARCDWQIEDLGTHGAESVDYPDYAVLVAQKISSGACDRGILICGTGIGMSMAANKIHGIRAAVCHDVVTAALSRRHNNANILCLGARVLHSGEVDDILRVWLESEFEGGRHARRVEKLHDLESS